jgi:hypothetical protein
LAWSWQVGLHDRNGRAAAHEVAMIAAAGVVGLQPALELGVEVSQASEVLAVEGRPVELLERGAWKRSQTALWLVDLGGIRWWRRARWAIAAVNWRPVNSGPLSS